MSSQMAYNGHFRFSLNIKKNVWLPAQIYVRFSSTNPWVYHQMKRLTAHIVYTVSMGYGLGHIGVFLQPT